MDNFFLHISIVLGLVLIISTYRAVFGPTVFDRIIGSGFIGTKVIVLLALIGFIFNRIDMFIDLALVYSILNFSGTLIFSKYFIRKGDE
ncbi:MAG: monovalent cation/H+ antiporter complex subunit F [Spirochaetota bacterium]|nr:monovalent cation/H+ antiporter complex subunit F [Spirochaetota bacterium]